MIDPAPTWTRAPSGSRARLAAAVAAAVDAVPGVRRTAGPVGMIATQHAGGTIAGVRLADQAVEVHVVARAVPLPPLVAAVRTMVHGVLTAADDSRRVDVTVVDLELPDPAPAPAPSEGRTVPEGSDG